jgi:hypothetical protein
MFLRDKLDSKGILWKGKVSQKLWFPYKNEVFIYFLVKAWQWNNWPKFI